MPDDVLNLIAPHRTELEALCRCFGVRRLDLFGSAASSTFDPATSDFDFVVEFADTRAEGYADRYLDLAEGLERLLGRPVDLVTERSIRNPHFRRAVAESRRAVYA